MIYFLIGYMWLYIHRPFEIWPWLAPYRIELVWGLVTLGFWLLFEKRWRSNRLVLAFTFLLSAVALSTVVNGERLFASQIVWEWYKAALFAVLIFTIPRDKRELKILVTALLICFALYMAHSYREFLCGRRQTRMGIPRMTSICSSYSPNGFATMVVCILPMVFPVWRLCHRNWHRAAVIGYVVLSVTCIILTGSRTAFVALVTLALIAALLSRYRVRVCLALLIAAPLVWASMRYDLQDRFMTLIDPSRGPSNAEVSADSRWEFFLLSIGLWREHPVFGVGPSGFAQFTGDELDREVSVHSLYGQLVGELGTVGILAFLAVLTCYGLNGLEIRRLSSSLPDESTMFLRSLSASLLLGIVMLLVVGFGGHNLYRYMWLWYGSFQIVAVDILRQQVANAQFTQWVLPSVDAGTSAFALDEGQMNEPYDWREFADDRVGKLG